MFICNHCPFVKHLKKDIVKLANFYMKVSRYSYPSNDNAAFSVASKALNLENGSTSVIPYIMLQKGLAVVAISSNSIATHPQVPYQGLFFLFILPLVFLDKYDESHGFLIHHLAEFLLHRMDQSLWQKKLKLLDTPSHIFTMRYTA